MDVGSYVAREAGDWVKGKLFTSPFLWIMPIPGSKFMNSAPV
jgi:hypothetical protein